MKIRLSKKFVVILGGGLVLCGASGAAAVLIGTDKLLGPSYTEINGLRCTTLKIVKIREGKSTWIRQYVTSDQAADGVTRVRTALRVARAVQEKEKADLVQVSMIDKAGPKERAQMRGRMIGAQVVYIPDLAKVPEGAAARPYSAFYVDGQPTGNGEYFGMRIDLPLEDVEHLEASLTDKADCVDPAAAEDPHGAGHSAPKPAHGDAKAASGHEGERGAEAADGGGHNGDDAHASGTEAAKHGETPSADGHETAPTRAAVPSALHDEQEQHGAAAVGPGGEAAASEARAHHEEAHGAQAEAPTAVNDETEDGASEQGFLQQIKSMILGDEAGTGAAEHKEAKAHGGDGTMHASKPAPEPRTSAEGGKRWSEASEEHEIQSPNLPADHEAAENKAETDDVSDADAAGAAWLEKFRGQLDGADGPANPAH